MTIANFLPITGKVRRKPGEALGVAVSSRAVSLLLSSLVFFAYYFSLNPC